MRSQMHNPNKGNCDYGLLRWENIVHQTVYREY